MTNTTKVRRYVATINVPGYMPESDESNVFSSARDAWEYLAGERERAENDACDETCEDGPACRWGYTHDLSDTYACLLALSAETVDVAALDSSMVNANRLGTVYGETPGYHGSHDLGIAYSVTEESVTVGVRFEHDDMPYETDDRETLEQINSGVLDVLVMTVVEMCPHCGEWSGPIDSLCNVVGQAGTLVGCVVTDPAEISDDYLRQTWRDLVMEHVSPKGE